VFDAWILPSRVVDPGKKVPDLNCEVQDLLLEVVDFEQEVPDLGSGGIPRPPRPNLTPGFIWVLAHRMRRSSDERVGVAALAGTSGSLPARRQLHVVHTSAARIRRPADVQLVPARATLRLPRRLRRDRRRIPRRLLVRPVYFSLIFVYLIHGSK